MFRSNCIFAADVTFITGAVLEVFSCYLTHLVAYLQQATQTEFGAMDSFNRLSSLYLESFHTWWKLKHQSICCGNRVMSPQNSGLLSNATLHNATWTITTMLTEILYSITINDFQCIETNNKTWLLTICKIAGEQRISYDTHQAICAWGLSQHISP